MHTRLSTEFNHCHSNKSHHHTNFGMTNKTEICESLIQRRFLLFLTHASFSRVSSRMTPCQFNLEYARRKASCNVADSVLVSSSKWPISSSSSTTPEGEATPTTCKGELGAASPPDFPGDERSNIILPIEFVGMVDGSTTLSHLASC
mmetsp:Transcript_51466/g.109478  ORF Transcript_51466/g.109478 Transcript_51466/m.109478 type:complete len:147 (-) Transcript_51466:1892-2332(-)